MHLHEPAEDPLERPVSRHELADQNPLGVGRLDDPIRQQPRGPGVDDEGVGTDKPHRLRLGAAAGQLREPAGRCRDDTHLRREGVDELVDLMDAAAGDQPTAEDHRQPRLEGLHLVEEMAGDEEAARPRPGPHERHELMAGHRIEAVERLVENEEIGIVGHGPGEFGPLPHPLGERREGAPGRLTEPHLFEGFFGQPPGRGRCEARQLHEVADPLPRRRGALGEIRCRAVTDPPQHPGVEEGALAEDADLADRRAKLAGDETEERRFAGAVGAEQAVGACAKFDRDIVDADDGAVELCDVGQGDHGGLVRGTSCGGRQARAGASTRHQRTTAETTDTIPSDSSGGRIACQRCSMPNTQAWITPRA